MIQNVDSIDGGNDSPILSLYIYPSGPFSTDIQVSDGGILLTHNGDSITVDNTLLDIGQSDDYYVYVVRTGDGAWGAATKLVSDGWPTDKVYIPLGKVTLGTDTDGAPCIVSIERYWTGGDYILTEMFPVIMTGNGDSPLTYNVTTLDGIDIIGGASSVVAFAPLNYRDSSFTYTAGNKGVAGYNSNGSFWYYCFNEHPSLADVGMPSLYVYDASITDAAQFAVTDGVIRIMNNGVAITPTGTGSATSLADGENYIAIEFSGGSWFIQNFGTDWPTATNLFIPLAVITVSDSIISSIERIWNGGDFWLEENFKITAEWDGTSDPPTYTSIQNLAGVDLTSAGASEPVLMNYRDADVSYEATSTSDGIAGWDSSGTGFWYFIFDEHIVQATACVAIVTGSHLAEDGITTCYDIAPAQYSMNVLVAGGSCP